MKSDLINNFANECKTKSILLIDNNHEDNECEEYYIQ